MFQSSESDEEEEDQDHKLTTRFTTESESDEDTYTIYAPRTKAEPIALDFASLTHSRSPTVTVSENHSLSTAGRPDDRVLVVAPSLRVFQQLGEDIKQQGALIRRTCNTYRYCVALVVVIFLILIGVIIFLLAKR